MSYLAIELVLGSAVCLLHLAIGLGIGAKLGRSTVCITGETFGPREEPGETQRLLAMWFDLRLRLGELTQCARQAQPMPMEIVSQWRSELLQLSNGLGEALERKPQNGGAPDEAHHSTSLTSDRCPLDEGMTGKEVVTNAQILELVSAPLDFDNHDQPLVRHRFSAKQPLAPAISSGPLPAEAFRMVQFHDLSIRDVRYFEDDLPSEDKVVIGLGVPKPVKWIAARIENSRSAFMYGRVGYLVTARLIASIDRRDPVATPQLLTHPLEKNP
jgi:hypothetical protein